MFNSTFIALALASNLSSPPDSSGYVLRDSLTEDIVISSLKAGTLTPITQTNLSKAEIEQRNVGMDLTYILQNTPSIVSRSDAGNFIGYSDLRLRGMTDSRISFSINGIPVNDPQTQGFYTNNFADLAASAQSIQIQRGVGTTGNGTAPFAGSINLITNDLKNPQFADLSASYGSFNTYRLAAQYGSGLTNNGRYAFYGRISKIKSDGYRNNSGADLTTYFWSGGYFGKKSILKLNIFGGITQSQLAFYGLDKTTYEQNRRTNFNTKQEVDEFRQNFFQLQYTYKIHDKLSFSSSAYYVHGKAPFFNVYVPGMPFYYVNMPDINTTTTGSDMLLSYKLNQNFFGTMAFIKYSTDRLTVDVGLHANHFTSNHSMEVPWASALPAGINPNHQAYFNTGRKRELSGFVKASYNTTDKLLLFADVQTRLTSWNYQAKDQAVYRDTFRVEPMQWLFVNPRIGARYDINKQISTYINAGTVSREPTRSDYLLDDRANFNVTQDLVKPERVVNVELGTNIRTQKLSADINLYFMEFQNEIMQTGEINIYGSTIKKNINGTSYRRGLELSFNYKPFKTFSFMNNSAVSMNRIRSYTQAFDVYENGVKLTEADGFTPIKVQKTFTNTIPLLSPSLIINQGFGYNPISWLHAELWGRYVSEVYLENTNIEGSKLPGYFVLDARLATDLAKFIGLKNTTIALMANNLTNTLYAPAGLASVRINRVNGIDTPIAIPSFFPAAGINFMASLNMKF